MKSSDLSPAKGGSKPSTNWCADTGPASTAFFLAISPTDHPRTWPGSFPAGLRKIELYEEGKPFAPWLFTIARRLALNAIRGRNRRREVPLPDRPVEEQSPEEPLCFGPLWQFAKERLSANAYAALRLHYAEDLPIEEVARVLDKNKIAVKVMLHRARRRLSEFSAQLKETQTT